MIKECDRVVLTAPVPKDHLEIGAVGTVVHVYADGKAFEVEFTTADGHTSVVATVDASGVRPVTGVPVFPRRLGAPTLSVEDVKRLADSDGE